MTAPLRGTPEAEPEKPGIKMLRFSLTATQMETIQKDGYMEATSRSLEKRMQKIRRE